MSYRLTRARGFVLVLGIAAILATLLGSSSHASASTTVNAAPRIGHVITPLPGCAVTFAPKVSSIKGRTCVVTADQLARAAARSNAAVTPSTVYAGGCFFDYYQNGPYLSSAWASGWGVCVHGVENNGDYYVPATITINGVTYKANDEASSWDSCTDGVFYANQPGTAPSDYYPPFSSGDFPWAVIPNAPVPNDSLSSAHVYYGDYAC